MCQHCCIKCLQRNCICRDFFEKLNHYPYFTCTVGISFENEIDKNELKLDENYSITEDKNANRKKSSVKKKNKETDHMYHSLSIKRSFLYKDKIKNTCLQLSNYHMRILVPGFEVGESIIRYFICLIKKNFKKLIFKEIKLVSMNMSTKMMKSMNLDLFNVKKKLEIIARTIRKDFRVYYNPKVSSDKAVTIDYLNYNGKIRIFSTGTIMAMGISEPIFMSKQLLLFKEIIKTQIQ